MRKLFFHLFEKSFIGALQNIQNRSPLIIQLYARRLIFGKKMARNRKNTLTSRQSNVGFFPTTLYY